MQTKLLLGAGKGFWPGARCRAACDGPWPSREKRGRLSPDSLGESQWFSVIRCFPKGLCFKNRNVHHFSPSEGQSCVVLAMGPARPRPQSRRLGRGDGVPHPGIRPCPAGKRMWRGGVCPPASLSHGGSGGSWKAGVGAGCPVQAASPAPAPPLSSLLLPPLLPALS